MECGLLRYRKMISSLLQDQQTGQSRCLMFRQKCSYVILMKRIKVYLLLLFVINSILSDTVSSVAISSDATFLISASLDKSVKMYDLHTKQQLHHFIDIHTGLPILILYFCVLIYYYSYYMVCCPIT